MKDVKAFTRSGKQCGTVTVIDRSRPGQRCVRYTDYKSTGVRNG